MLYATKKENRENILQDIKKQTATLQEKLDESLERLAQDPAEQMGWVGQDIVLLSAKIKDFTRLHNHLLTHDWQEVFDYWFETFSHKAISNSAADSTGTFHRASAKVLGAYYVTVTLKISGIKASGWPHPLQRVKEQLEWEAKNPNA